MRTWCHPCATRATYWAVYSDGRRCEVTLADAKAFGDEWAKEGVRLMTRVSNLPLECIGTVEYADHNP